MAVSFKLSWKEDQSCVVALPSTSLVYRSGLSGLVQAASEALPIPEQTT